ncbi:MULTISPECIES: cation:proton antiporter [Massilia]|uniref:Cation:proton antiporter n=1 Tax=Massilia orientalis TaxID=3050128 RepID=A0ACC7MHJ2_9BURK|nr:MULTISPECIES: cation:proton antiporter [unclassified Massilia]KQY16478.1 sodium:proton antiporter [Massilia sp. Root133]KQZ51989.1 sodium:proton antiporter [Massilia sp. Root1485]MDN4041852.1 cation:proton antiporter [Massilia sp. YIM B02787]
MQEFLSVLTSLAWPFAITLAWLVGEFGQRWTGLPRISFYGLVGFILAAPQLGVLPLPPSGGGTTLLLADVGFGLILFELGYRINLRWLRTNPWIGITGLFEAGLTFVGVYLVANAFGAALIDRLMLASLSMATSPATVVRVINEQKSSGQVTERALHLCALNCVLAVFAFNATVGLWIFRTFEDVGDALWNSLVVLGVSAFTGAVFGLVVPGILRLLGKLAQDATVAFALAVILLVAITYALGLSPVVAALAFGLAARHRRVAFSQAQRNFGALGELLTVVLFVFAASTLDWRRVWAGALLAGALVLVRLLAKTAGVTAFAHLSGISWRKGALTGVALTPLSVFVILLIEHARHAGVQVVEELRAVAAVTMLLEVFGPIILQRALVWAREAPEVNHAA